MASFIYSSEKVNDVIISAGAKWYPTINANSELKKLIREKYFNYCKVTNKSGQEIKVHIGNQTIRIAAGDGFEWDRNTPIHFVNVIIENLDAANNIGIGEVIIEYGRIV